MGTPAIDTWHQLIEDRNAAGLDEILADDVVLSIADINAVSASRPGNSMPARHFDR